MAKACAETYKGCVLSQLAVNIIHKVICATKICLGVWWDIYIDSLNTA